MSNIPQDDQNQPAPGVQHEAVPEAHQDRREKQFLPVREPVFNMPSIIVALAALMLTIHGMREWVLTAATDQYVILLFSFIPARYSGELADFWPLAKYWTPFTYSLLHSDWLHIGVNLLWLAAFGSPVASRIGAGRSIGLACVTSAGGAFAHWFSYGNELVPMIGASAVVSGYMGAATRFAFTGKGVAGRLNVHGPALTLLGSLTNPRIMVFILVWFGLNYLFGSGVVPVAGSQVSIAWQAHVGGFLAGLLFFPLFDRKGRV
ncbi:MAG: rhomboid family intramembrane serine protease [Nitratireductor sp.]